VLGRVGALGEDACAFDDDIGADFLPGNLGRVLFIENPKLAFTHFYPIGRRIDLLLERVMNGIIFEQMRQSLYVPEIVNPDDLNLLVFQRRPKNKTPDAPESVDAHFYSCHYFLPPPDGSNFRRFSNYFTINPGVAECGRQA
jgi:hypothetical protein